MGTSLLMLLERAGHLILVVAVAAVAVTEMAGLLRHFDVFAIRALVLDLPGVSSVVFRLRLRLGVAATPALLALLAP
jgi:hypothetical protein